MRRPRGPAALVALTGLGLITGPAAATDGNLYPHGASIWAVGPQFTAQVLAGPVWQLQAPALSPASTGNQWEMNWGCPVAGSEIAAVQWSALRTQAPSSLALEVTGDRRVIWSEGDSAIPQSPQPGRAYDVRLPGGNCNVHLALNQIEGRNQHARAYFIDSPRVLVRDLTAPSVSLSGLPPGWTSGSELHVGWTVSDNFDGDGVAGQRIVVGGRTLWSGAPGVGDHDADVGLSGVPDGVHRVEAQVAGDGTAGASADGQISLDRTPPAASGLSSSYSGEQGTATLSWTATDNLSGVGVSRAEVNEATDGKGDGPWNAAGTTQGPGSKTAGVRDPRLADGMHAWRVVATDAAGNTATTTASGRVAIDTTPPRVDVHQVPAGWVNRAEIDLTATDNLQSALGLGATEIDVNAASDGGDAGEWRRLSTAAAPPGRRVIPIDLAGLEDGRHAVRIVVRNGGPFSSSLVSEKRALLRVDLTDPSVSRATFSPGGARPMTVAWLADDADSGVAAVTVQWREGTAWRTLAGEKAANGAGSMVIDASALPDGERTMRVLVADGAGNVTARVGTAQISGGGLGSAAGDPAGRLRAARLEVVVTGARAQRRAGRAVLVRRVVTGARLRIGGRLLDRSGHGIVGAEVQVRDQRGRLIGRGLTRRNGRFSIEARPVGGGYVRIGVAVGRGLLPQRASVDVRLEVRPAVALSVSNAAPVVGEEVLFSGRLRPSPADLGLGSRKGIVLEWLDPVRRIWRPVVNARLRADGTFAIPWTFGLGGLTIPMRVVVPQEVGWPLLPVRSGVIRMRVR